MGEPGEHALIGRTRELASLDDAIQRATDGRPSVVLVAGEAGIGKSALLAASLARAADAGVRTLRGHCLDRGAGGYPYAPFVEVFRSLIVATEAARLPALLGPARGEFARLLPELAGRIGGSTLAPLAAGPGAQVHLYELILGTLERLTVDQPLIVAIEDLQWADDASRDLLGFLVGTVRTGRVGLFVSLRTDRIVRDRRLGAFLGEFEQDDRLRRIDLQRLQRTEIADLMTVELGQAPAPKLVTAIQTRSGGNPFLARQLLALERSAPDAPLPAVIRDVLRARMEEVSPTTLQLLRVAAVGGTVIDERLLAVITGRPEADVANALREAVGASLVAIDPGRPRRQLVFSHDLLREAVADDLTPRELARIHEAYAEAQERDSSLAPPGAAAAAELARHWDGAGQPGRALVATVHAAEAAEGVAAARLYGRALDLLDASGLHADAADRADPADRTNWTDAGEDGADETVPDEIDLVARCAEAASLAGEYERAADLGRRAVEAARVHSPADLARLDERLRWYLWEAGAVQDAVARSEDAIAAIPVDPPSATRSRALAHLAGILMFSGRAVESTPIAREALRVAREVGALPEAAMALGVLAWDEAMAGAVEAGVADLRDGLAIAELVRRDEGIALGHVNLSALLEATGRTHEALNAAGVGLAAVGRLGLADTYGGVLHGTAASAAFDLGSWADAASHLAMALQARVPAEDAISIRSTGARVSLGLGDLVAARRHLEAGVLLAERPTAARHRPGLVATAVELDLAEGRVARAVQRISDWLATAAEVAWPGPTAVLCATGLRVFAEAAPLARLGALPDGGAAAAGGLLDRLGAVADGEDPRVPAIRLLAAAEVTRLVGPPAPAAWEAAAAGFDAIAFPYPAAYCRLREAEAHLASHGSRSAAADALRAAWVSATALGASRLVTDIGDLARRARIDLDPRAASGAEGEDRDGGAPALLRFGLTTREAEVLRLVAAGRTNREIGDALFISGKTASVHVSNIIAKLQVSGRIEAAALALRLGLADDPVPVPATQATR